MWFLSWWSDVIRTELPGIQNWKVASLCVMAFCLWDFGWPVVRLDCLRVAPAIVLFWASRFATKVRRVWLVLGVMST